MRLTKKNSLGSYFANIKPIDSGLEKDLTIYGEFPIKLGQFEDIEDEFGIKLNVLFNALMNGIFYKTTIDVDYEQHDSGFYSSTKKKIIAHTLPKLKRHKGILCFEISWREHLLLSDYGKTWALTKEELYETKD